MGSIAPYLLGRRGPGAFVGAGGGGGGGGGSSGGGGFEEEPIATINASGDVSIKGKVKPGSFGKFVYPLATIVADHIYTFRYTPHFSQLSQQGKLAMVGFGLKTNNDFHIVGLRGNGSTGLDKYKVQGTSPNGWNKQTGHTETDGNAPVNGTQAGPNYIRLITAADGTTITFQTSGNSGVNWDTEFAAYTPTPFTNISGVTTFGIALWFNNTDTGPFSVDIDQFQDVTADLATPASFTFAGTALTKSVDQDIGASPPDTAATWNTEISDTDTFHDTGSNTSRITVPSAHNGKIGILSASIYSSHSNDAGERMAVSFRKNGSASWDGCAGMAAKTSFGTQNMGTIQSAPFVLTTGDIYELYLHPESAAGNTTKSYASFRLTVLTA